MFAPGVYGQSAFVHDGRVYIIGGNSAQGAVANVHAAAFLGPTSLSPWQLVAPFQNGVASTAVVVIERPMAAVAIAPAATTAPSPDAGTNDAGTTVATSVTGPSTGYVLIPAGAFLIGSPDSEPGRYGYEGPQHPITIARPFYMKRTEVTCNEWLAMMVTLPNGAAACTTEPVTCVGWNGAVEYANAVSLFEGLPPCYTGTRDNWTFAGLDCPGYRLPTEAEWEYAARAGTTGPYYAEPLWSIAWYEGNSGMVIHPVGQKAQNAWGLEGIIGNGHEWTCSDYREDYGTSGPIAAEECSTTLARKSTRGGAYGWSAAESRVANRGWRDPTLNRCGWASAFRLVRTRR